jgi:hypothetical protein
VEISACPGALDQVIALDPKFAKAYSGLSDTLILLYTNYDAFEPDEIFPKSKGLLDNDRARPE